MNLTPEDTLLNALEDLGLIHPDWEGIDHENLPKDIREGITQGLNQAIRLIKVE